MKHICNHAKRAKRLALLSTLAAMLLAGCDRKSSKPGTENTSETVAEQSSRSASGATSVDGGFASPEEVFEAMKKLPPDEIGPLVTSEDRVLLSYMQVMLAYGLHQFEQDTNRKRAIEEGFEELLARYDLTDKLEITENDEKFEENAIRAFGDVDTMTFLSDLGTFFKKFVPMEEMEPVSMGELAVEGDRAEAMILFSDGTEERNFFVRSGDRWFLSARSILYPEEEGQGTGSPEITITTEVLLRVTFDNARSWKSATAEQLLEGVSYDRDHTPKLEKMENSDSLQVKLIFWVPNSIAIQSIIGTIKQVRGVKEVEHLVDFVIEEPPRRPSPEIAYGRGADVSEVDLSFFLEPGAQESRRWRLIEGGGISAKFVGAVMVNHIPSLELESPQGKRRRFPAWRLAPPEIAHAQQFTGLALAPLSDLEAWTNDDGRKMSARLIGAASDGQYVFVRKDGKAFEIAHDSFAPDSQKRIARLELEGALLHLKHVAANAPQEKQKEAALYRLLTLLAAKNAWEDVNERAKQYLSTQGYRRYAGAVTLALARSYEHRAMPEDAIAAYLMVFGAHTGQIDVSAPAVNRIMALAWKRNSGKEDRQRAYRLGHRYRKDTVHLRSQMTEEEKVLWQKVKDLVEQYEATPGIEKIVVE